MHFNLLRGKPCSKKSEVKTLINTSGCFYNLPTFIMRLFFGFIDLDEIALEFKSQHKKLLELGVNVNLLNSEQHLHVFSPINKIMESEISETSIKKIRSIESSLNSLDGRFFRKFCFIFLKSICDFRFGKFVEFSKKYDAYIVHPGA
jgi:predicted glycoside hydrolase/deacetylase ChbG (UPF0249 family)